MTFESILFLPALAANAPEKREPPAYFHDLNLDRIVEGITAGWKEYDLVPFFLAAPVDPDTISYRQEVIRDLDGPTLMPHVQTFSKRMRGARQRLRAAAQLEYPYERERWFLGAVREYYEAVEDFSTALTSLDLRSRAMQAFRDYLAEYVASPEFRVFIADAAALLHDLSAIHYRLLIRDGTITVLAGDDALDYAAALAQTFERFRHSVVANHRLTVPPPGRLNHIDAQVLEGVARLHPAVFSALDTFYTSHARFEDERIRRFDREVQFYVAYLEYIGPLARAGLSFCCPQLSTTSKAESARKTFDLALAATRASVVTNDFALHGAERIFVVTGPNQGGKTTFARTYGQLHHLASIGLPVPGSDVQLFLFDQLFTHFERAEDVMTLRGRLQDDLIRVHKILQAATSSSIVILNEVFASTTAEDALGLSRKVMTQLSRIDLLAVVVTFLDELASFDVKTVSMVAVVDTRDRTVRTLRIERRPADGVAHALALAAKHHVTYDELRGRLQR